MKYINIADTLRARIQNGTYPQNTMLPNQLELVEEFKVSRMTIKNALNILAMEGLVVSKRGSGTLVINTTLLTKDTSSVYEYRGLSHQMKLKKRDLSTKVLDFKVAFPDAKVQQMLQISENDPIFEFIRLRLLDGSPYVLEYSFMPVDLVKGLSVEILGNSVYKYVLDDLGHKFAGAYRTVQSDKSNALDQECLDCASDDPVLELEQIIYLESGRPIDYSRSRSRYDVKAYSFFDMNPSISHNKSTRPNTHNDEM